jgi:hypothetical protein
VKRKIIIHEPISKTIGTLGLSRDILLTVLNYLHSDVPHNYEKTRNGRTKFGFLHRRAFIEANGIKHLFTFTR